MQQVPTLSLPRWGPRKQEYFSHSYTPPSLPSPCIVRDPLGGHLHLLLFFHNELLLVKWRWVGRCLQKTQEPNTPNPFPLCSYDICAGIEASPNDLESLLMRESSFNLGVGRLPLQGSDGTFGSGSCAQWVLWCHTILNLLFCVWKTLVAITALGILCDNTWNWDTPRVCASVGGSCCVFLGHSQWFSDGLPLGQLVSIHRLRLAVGLLLTWPTRCVACSRRSNSKDLVP